MTALDILVLICVGTAGMLGLKRGFVTEILSLGAWIVAILAVKVLHEPVKIALTDVVGTESGAAVLSFSLVFGLTMLIGRMVARSIGDVSKQSVVGMFDRVLGLGFGAIKGLIGASLGFLFVSLIYDTVYSKEAERPAWMTNSKTYPLLSASSGAIVTFVNERRSSHADPSEEQARDGVEPAL